MARYADIDALSRTIKLAWDTSDSEDFEKSVFIALGTAPTADVVERKDLDNITEAHEQIGYEKGYRDGYAQAIEEMNERREDELQV